MNQGNRAERGDTPQARKTIAIQRGRWWPQTVEQERDTISNKYVCNVWGKRNERTNVGG